MKILKLDPAESKKEFGSELVYYYAQGEYSADEFNAALRCQYGLHAHPVEINTCTHENLGGVITVTDECHVDSVKWYKGKTQATWIDLSNIEFCPQKTLELVSNLFAS